MSSKKQSTQHRQKQEQTKVDTRGQSMSKMLKPGLWGANGIRVRWASYWVHKAVYIKFNHKETGKSESVLSFKTSKLRIYVTKDLQVKLTDGDKVER